MTTDVTINQLIAKVREIAAKRPDFVYEVPDGGDVCQYVHEDGEPGCIFGHAFTALGVEPDQLAKLDGVGVITGVLDKLEIEHTEEERAWCAMVQSLQDTGDPWGEAVSESNALAGTP